MPYVLPAMLDSIPRALRTPVSAAERAANSSAAPLPGVPRRARTPAAHSSTVRIGFTLLPPTPPEHSTSGPGAPSFDRSGPAMIATLASPQTPLLHVSSSTPLPRVALGPRSRRVRARESCESLAPVAFPVDASANYVLDSPTARHQPVSPGKQGTLRLSMDAIRAGMRRSSSTDASKVESIPSATSTSSVGLRKKSGELVKPSLKHAHTLSGGFPTQAMLSRSAPATPTTPKFVHFDAQLEHVRLFLAEQKPTAVSRDGSPIETSEGEEFPWSGRNYEEDHSAVRIKHSTVPSFVSIDGADVRLSSLALADDNKSLSGRVLVRNLAFEKFVAVRFTFDYWQTTSEVSARWVETVEPGVDRFAFSIKLGDVLHRIEEKTLFVAVRYTTAGREIWDSNHGQNYMVAFTKEPKQRASKSSRMSDLRKSLEKVMQDEEDHVPVLQIKQRVRPSVRQMSFGGFESPKPSVVAIAPVAPVTTKLGARYDFGAAPRSRFCADGFKMPTTRPQLSTEIKPVLDAKLCASPRDLEDSLRTRFPIESDSPAFDSTPQAPTGKRHHHRAAYFDAWSFPAPGVKRTSSGGPSAEELDSVPASWLDATELGDSLASTPSITSSSSPSASPLPPPSPEIEASDPVGNVIADPSDYSSFLDRFCFFTGPGATNARRTHSRSSSDSCMPYGIDHTARTLRAVSSTLSSTSALSTNSSGSSDVAVTPRAGTPVFDLPVLPTIAPALS